MTQSAFVGVYNTLALYAIIQPFPLFPYKLHRFSLDIWIFSPRRLFSREIFAFKRSRFSHINHRFKSIFLIIWQKCSICCRVCVFYCLIHYLRFIPFRPWQQFRLTIQITYFIHFDKSIARNYTHFLVVKAHLHRICLNFYCESTNQFACQYLTFSFWTHHFFTGFISFPTYGQRKSLRMWSWNGWFL